MRSAFVLFTTTALLLLPFSALAADIAVAYSPARGESASDDDLLDAYKLSMKTPGITAYTFATTWDEVSGPQQPRIKDLQTATHFGLDQHLSAFLSINLVSGVNRTVPADFRKSSWGTQAMLLQFDNMIANIAPMAGSNVKWVSLGKDADLYLAKNPDEIESFTTFYRQAANAIKRRYPGAKIGVGITYEGLIGSRKDIAEQLLAVSDAAFVSYYPQSDYKVKPDEDILKELSELIATPFNKPLVFTEIGFPSERRAGASEKSQEAFIQSTLPVLKASPSVSLINVSQLHDSGDKACRTILDDAAAKGKDAEAFYCSTGLIELKGKDKDSWRAFKKAIKPAPTATP